MTDLDPWDSALLSALDAPDSGSLETIDELAESSGISQPLLEVLAREGLLIPQIDEPSPLFDPSDAEAVKAGLELVSDGLPLAELLDLARNMDEAMRPVAEQAVDVFARFVRDSVEASAATGEEAAARLVEAFRSMLPATSRLVAHHFRSLLVASARERITDR